MANPTPLEGSESRDFDNLGLEVEQIIINGKVVLAPQQSLVADPASTTLSATTKTGVATTLTSNHGFVRFAATKDVSADTGGTPTEAAFHTVPARSIIYCVECETLTAMNGGTSSSMEIGVNGNVDQFIDTSDYDPGTGATIAASLGGTNNDTKVPLYSATAVALVTSHINDGSATTGSIQTTVVYQTLSSVDLDDVDTQTAAFAVDVAAYDTAVGQAIVDLDAHNLVMDNILNVLEAHGLMADA